MRTACFIAITSLLIGRAEVVAGEPVVADRPNILWISSEDNGQQLGCYGDDYADTPNLDALATSGMRYATCWSNAPVCAPARTTIITGLYPSSTGAEHMRSMTTLPKTIGDETVQMFPVYLREAGYYCTNRSKEDYNVEKTGQVWDESSTKAHYRNRADGQPFFAVFNETISHESKIRTRPHEQVHDPAGVTVPPYHPDLPEVRQDWAQYYDKMTEMDRRLGKHLDDLEQAGLADETIVVYFGDHGSGMPRSKRTPFDSGLRVPLIVRFPKKYRHLAPAEYTVGGVSERLVSFIDFAPTMLSLIGTEPPKWMQGHAFAGPFVAEPPKYLFGFRGRMDSRVDFVRSVTNGKHVLVRNYLPHLPHGQHVAYQFETPTTRLWKDAFDRGELSDVQSRFWQPRDGVELFDLEADPYETKNVATRRGRSVIVSELLTAIEDWQRETRDIGFLPEGMLDRLAHEAGVSRYEYGHSDTYPLDQLIELTRPLGRPGSSSSEAIAAAAQGVVYAEHPAVRFWNAMTLLNQKTSIAGAEEALLDAIEDSSPTVRVAAAEVLATRFEALEPGINDPVYPALITLRNAANYQRSSVYTANAALNVIERLGSKAAPIRSAVLAVPDPNGDKTVPERSQKYIGHMLEAIREQ